MDKPQLLQEIRILTERKTALVDAVEASEVRLSVLEKDIELATANLDVISRNIEKEKALIEEYKGLREAEAEELSKIHDQRVASLP